MHRITTVTAQVVAFWRRRFHINKQCGSAYEGRHRVNAWCAVRTDSGEVSNPSSQSDGAKSGKLRRGKFKLPPTHRSPLNWSAIRRYLIRALQMSEVLDDSPGAGRADKRF